MNLDSQSTPITIEISGSTQTKSHDSELCKSQRGYIPCKRLKSKVDPS